MDDNTTLSLVSRQERGVITRQSQTFGESVNGIPLVYWPAERTSDLGRLLVLAAVHGDESQTTVVLSEALRSLPVGELAASVVLAANPDGALLGTRGNAHGVDLNRNLPTADWSADPVAYRWGPDTPRDVRLSPGASPGSEPEAAALLGLIEDLAPQTIVSLHAPLACIDDPTRSPLAQWLAAETQMPLVDDVGYLTPGSLGTWGQENGRTVITYEFGHEAVAHLTKRHHLPIVRLLSGEPPE